MMPQIDPGSMDELLVQLGRAHADQLALCDRLEALADSLPGIDRQACLHTARALGPLIARAQMLEESLLFPALERLSPIVPEMPETLARLRFEHYEDLCYAEELYETLIGYGRGAPSVSPDAAGYMLRGFFEGMRRHIAFERQLMTPLLRTATLH